MQMSADNPDARQMLQDSLDDLRQQFAESGLQAGSFDVSTGDHSSQQNFPTPSGEVPRNSAEYTMDDETFFARLGAVVPQDATTPDGALDVRV
jgi:hypothetical protein